MIMWAVTARKYQSSPRLVPQPLLPPAGMKGVVVMRSAWPPSRSPTATSRSDFTLRADKKKPGKMNDQCYEYWGWLFRYSDFDMRCRIFWFGLVGAIFFWSLCESSCSARFSSDFMRLAAEIYYVVLRVTCSWNQTLPVTTVANIADRSAGSWKLSS